MTELHEGENSSSTCFQSTEELRARYKFRAQPLKSLSLGDLADLLVLYAVGEMSMGLLSQVTGMRRDDLTKLHQGAIERSEALLESYRKSEESRFQESYKSSQKRGADTPSGSGEEPS
jgi:hypothetical protein